MMAYMFHPKYAELVEKATRESADNSNPDLADIDSIGADCAACFLLTADTQPAGLKAALITLFLNEDDADLTALSAHFSAAVHIGYNLAKSREK